MFRFLLLFPFFKDLKQRDLLSKQARRQYFLYVDSSFENWISNYVQMLEKNLMKKDDLGKTTTFLNIDEIFKDDIHKNKGHNDEQD